MQSSRWRGLKPVKVEKDTAVMHLVIWMCSLGHRPVTTHHTEGPQPTQEAFPHQLMWCNGTSDALSSTWGYEGPRGPFGLACHSSTERVTFSWRLGTVCTQRFRPPRPLSALSLLAIAARFCWCGRDQGPPALQGRQ